MRNRRVLRGIVNTYQYQGATHLIVDDMNYNDAWKVVKFVIAPVDVTSSSAGARDCVAVLATHADALQGYVASVINWTWSDRRQIAWTSIVMSGDTEVADWSFGLIDPQHIVVRDLYLGLSAQSATGTTEFNYFIELERVKLDDNQSVMALIQEEGQGA
jgi:hypothetical protein